uniref:Uncharacterized protein n=1 Tax=Arundo donax TaxID=35708 RepID=A0A0A9HI46_ARUDO
MKKIVWVALEKKYDNNRGSLRSNGVPSWCPWRRATAPSRQRRPASSETLAASPPPWLVAATCQD